jgi:hypothetical protein
MLSTVASVVSPTAKVMCLGVYHFSNPGLDAVKSSVQDMMSDKRQAEVQQVVDQIRKFRPTKIAIEWPTERQAKVNEEYQAYQQNKRPLKVYEHEQIGFRLAKIFKHTTVFAVDHKLDLDFDAPFNFLKVHNPTALKAINEQLPLIGKAMTEIDQKYTVSQILSIYNTHEAIQQNHRFYVKLAEYTDGIQYPGADMLATWYQRNVRIYANIKKITTPGDRVLVIFGAGHIKILNDLFVESGEFEVVSPEKYLSKAPIRKLPIDL